MDAIEAMLLRRSVQQYTTQPVEDEVIDELLRAAMSACSAGSTEPWHFVVIQERRVLDNIAKLHPYAQMAKEAPVVVAVCGDEQTQKYMGLWVQDCAAATENLLIAARAKGLGAVWLRVFPFVKLISAIKKLLSTPEHVTPFSLIPLGYPAEMKPPVDHYSSAHIRYNTW